MEQLKLGSASFFLLKKNFYLQFLSFLLRKLIRKSVEMANRSLNKGKLQQLISPISPSIYKQKMGKVLQGLKVKSLGYYFFVEEDNIQKKAKLLFIQYFSDYSQLFGTKKMINQPLLFSKNQNIYFSTYTFLVTLQKSNCKNDFHQVEYGEK